MPLIIRVSDDRFSFVNSISYTLNHIDLVVTDFLISLITYLVQTCSDMECVLCVLYVLCVSACCVLFVCVVCVYHIIARLLNVAEYFILLLMEMMRHCTVL